MAVSLIFTVLNEGQHVRRLLDSVMAQTRRPDEVVACDGGSRDGTTAAIEEYSGRLPLKIISLPGSNISQGRNAAIRAAGGEIIAVTDAGVWLEPDWLEQLLAAGGWEGASGDRREVVMVAGFYRSDPQTTFERALGATTLPELRDIHPARFLPSSRSVAFRKEAWAAAGGYPEWLDYSEDVVFDLAVRRKFGASATAFAPGAVAHFRPRQSLAAFARQFFNYARGDGQAGLWPKIHFVRYFAYFVAAPLLVYAALTVSPWLWSLAALAGLAYVRRPLQRLAGRRSWGAVAWVPIIRLTGDWAKMAGYPVGVWRRLSRRAA